MIGNIPAALAQIVRTRTTNGIHETLSKLDSKSGWYSRKWLKAAKTIIDNAVKNWVLANSIFGGNFLMKNGIIPKI